MATIKRYLQSKVNAYGESEVMLRLSVSRGCVVRLHTGLYVHRDRWRDGGVVKPRANRVEAERLLALEGELAAMEGHVLRWVLSMVTADVTGESVRRELERYRRERVGASTCERGGCEPRGGMVFV